MPAFGLPCLRGGQFKRKERIPVKKGMILVLCLALALLFAGCEGGMTNPTASPTERPVTQAPITSDTPATEMPAEQTPSGTGVH